MKHLTNYKQYVKNESVKDLAVGGLMALSTLGYGPDATKEKDNISQNQITQSDSSNIIVKSSSIKRSKLNKASVEGLELIRTNITYNGKIIAGLSSIEYDYVNRRLIRKITYTIINEEYNHLAANIIKFYLNVDPGCEVEVVLSK